MTLDYNAIIMAISAAILSGMGTAIIASYSDCLHTNTAPFVLLSASCAANLNAFITIFKALGQTDNILTYS